MSQGFQNGNIISFVSDDEFESWPQQNLHIAQQSRRSDKLRVQQHGFDAAAAEQAAGHPLVSIQEEADEEEEEEGVGISYDGPAAGTSNMLISEMFNFPRAPASGLHLTGLLQGAPCSTAVMSCHRLIQQSHADNFYGCNRPEQAPYSSTASWSSSSVVLGQDSAAAVVKLQHHGLNHYSSQPFLHQQACHQQGQQAQMSYGPVAALTTFRNSSLYARAAQELLQEFCSVGRGQHYLSSSGINIKGGRRTSSSLNPPNPSHIRGGAASWAAAATASSSSSKENPAAPMSSADTFQTQRKKSKLLSMLDEVERRYNHYCEQLKMVVNSLDSVMGLGAATPYTALAQKAMSRHFRCLKDAITGQLMQTCELLGDKEGAINGSAGGLTKVETPKLRLIDQSLRQQRAFHQLGMMDQDHGWRTRRGLPDRSVTMLRAWLFDHFLHPYPSDADKHLLARQTGLSRNQVSNWFINARVRLWKPMIEDMYQKEAKEEEVSQQQQQKPQTQQHNDPDETNSHNTIILSAVTKRQNDRSMSPAHNPTLILQTPDSGSLEYVPMPRQNLRPLVAPINSHPQPQPEDDDAASSAVIFSRGPPQNDMYRRPAAMLGPSAAASQGRFGAAATTTAAAATTTAAARTGDLSLTLGLRHAGVNPPDIGRFDL